DTQQTDTYYIVAHFHYVLFGGALFGFVGGWYFWWPKVFGHYLNDKIGKVNFWLLFVGFNLTFGPMHILGLQGMPRRTYTYRDGYGFNEWNLVSTIGAFTIATSFLIFFWNIRKSYKDHKANPVAIPADPWDARSLEWSIQSPTPAHNFDISPTVHRLDDFWHRKYQENADGKLVRVATSEDIVQAGNPEGVHLPSPSYWPLVISLGLPLVAWGLIFNLWLCLPGALLIIGGIYGWVLEPATAPEGDHGHGDDHAPAATDDSGDEAEPADTKAEEAAPVD
ncbi:MAG TPA: cytochrome c oxidase subunit 4, partial [Iamia sp.]